MSSTIFNELNKKIETTLINPWLDEMNERMLHSRLSASEEFHASYDSQNKTIALSYTDKDKRETLHIEGTFNSQRHTITFHGLRTQDSHPPSLHIVHLPDNKVDETRHLLQAAMRFDMGKTQKTVEKVDLKEIKATAKTVRFKNIPA